MKPIDNLTATISKTADGRFDYLQVLSGDQFCINIVLIAGEITVLDARPTGEPGAQND